MPTEKKSWLCNRKKSVPKRVPVLGGATGFIPNPPVSSSVLAVWHVATNADESWHVKSFVSIVPVPICLIASCNAWISWFVSVYWKPALYNPFHCCHFSKNSNELRPKSHRHLILLYSFSLQKWRTCSSSGLQCHSFVCPCMICRFLLWTWFDF